MASNLISFFRSRFHVCAVHGRHNICVRTGNFCLQSFSTRCLNPRTHPLRAENGQFCHSVVQSASGKLQVSVFPPEQEPIPKTQIYVLLKPEIDLVCRTWFLPSKVSCGHAFFRQVSGACSRNRCQKQRGIRKHKKWQESGSKFIPDSSLKSMMQTGTGLSDCCCIAHKLAPQCYLIETKEDTPTRHFLSEWLEMICCSLRHWSRISNEGLDLWDNVSKIRVVLLNFLWPVWFRQSGRQAACTSASGPGKQFLTISRYSQSIMAGGWDDIVCQSMRAAVCSHARSQQFSIWISDWLVNKYLQHDWAFNIGEQALDICVTDFSSAPVSIFVLGRTLLGLKIKNCSWNTRQGYEGCWPMLFSLLRLRLQESETCTAWQNWENCVSWRSLITTLAVLSPTSQVGVCECFPLALLEWESAATAPTATRVLTLPNGRNGRSFADPVLSTLWTQQSLTCHQHPLHINTC